MRTFLQIKGNKKIPSEPGCYLFKDKEGTIIYIGKAKDLNKRVRSYFSKNHDSEKTTILVSSIWDVDTIITRTEKEAFILENNLIKQHQPKYNINLKDAKGYAYLCLTDEVFPRLIIARHKAVKMGKIKGEFFGPFPSAETRDKIAKTLRMLFKIRTCKRLPKRACLRYHIGLCEAPCVDKVSEKDYLEHIASVRRYLRGNVSGLLKDLDKKMKKHASAQEFEKAKVLRDQIFSLEALEERQVVERQREFDQDIINMTELDGDVYLVMFNVKKGVLMNKKEFRFPLVSDYLDEFILQYYDEETIPKEVIVPKKTDPLLPLVLSEKKGSKVLVTIPQKGEKKELLRLIKKNIEVQLSKKDLAAEDLMKHLKLQQKPEVIECFDISHLGGTETVASMVQFRGGVPDKSNYRRFKIRSVEGEIDDFKSMREVVQRRYKRLIEETGEMPDLIVIDGGKGQLSSAMTELNALGLTIPTIGLAKREEEIFVPGISFPIKMSRESHGLKLLQQARDEAHRFAVTYQRLRRSKKAKE